MKKFMKHARKTLAALLSIAMLASTMPVLAAPSLIGEGSDQSPYLLSSAEDLIFVSDMVRHGEKDYASASYILLNDIDFGKYEGFFGIGQYNDGDENCWFKGRFDGAGHKIFDYKSLADLKDFTSFFPAISSGAIIENITFISPKISAGSKASVAVGYAYNSTIRNVKIYGASVESVSNSAGGVVNTAERSMIENCSVLESTVYSYSSAGGIACDVLAGTTISECQFKGVVSDCFSDGEVPSSLGGIASFTNILSKPSDAKNILVENCLAQGSAIAKSAYSSGGIVGLLSDTNPAAVNIKILNCISNMEVEAKKAGSQTECYAGGIFGGFLSISQGPEKSYFIQGNLAFGGRVTAEGGEAGRIYPADIDGFGCFWQIANQGMLVNGIIADESNHNGTGASVESILDGSALLMHFMKSPWGFKPGALPYLLNGGEEGTAEPNVFIKAPQTIEGKAGTEFKAELWLGRWENGIKALEAVLSVPYAVEPVSLQPAESLSGGSFSYSLDNSGKLRAVYMNTGEAKNIDLILGQAGSPAAEITFKLVYDLAGGDKITLSADSLRLISSPSAEPLSLDVSMAVKSVEIRGDLQYPTLKARELFAGDGIDLIPENMKAVAVEITGLSDAIGLTHGSYQFFYAPEFEIAMTYIALVDKGEPLSSFEGYNSYSESQLDKIAFGKASGEAGALNAQDALAILSFWLRKAAPEGHKGILSSNVSADGRIDTVDALAVVERFVSQVPFAILSK